MVEAAAAAAAAAGSDEKQEEADPITAAGNTQDENGDWQEHEEEEDAVIDPEVPDVDQFSDLSAWYSFEVARQLTVCGDNGKVTEKMAGQRI